MLHNRIASFLFLASSAFCSHASWLESINIQAITKTFAADMISYNIDTGSTWSYTVYYFPNECCFYGEELHWGGCLIERIGIPSPEKFFLECQKRYKSGLISTHLVDLVDLTYF